MHALIRALSAFVFACLTALPARALQVIPGGAAQGDAPMRLAGWQSFFHGDPPPLAKSPPPKQLAVVSTQAGTKPDPQVESFLRLLADAVMARDGAMLLPRVSDKYAIEDLPDDATASDFLLQAIAKMPGPTEMAILSVETTGAARTAKVEFRYGMDKAKLRTFRFDAGGKLLGCDMFSLMRR
jgi:hypothetical protein